MLQRLRNLRLLSAQSRRCVHVNSDASSDAKESEATFDREFDDIKLDDFIELYKDDARAKERIGEFLTEYEFAKYNSLGRVPSKITIDDMKQVLEEGVSPYSRGKIIHYLFKREMDRRASRMRTERAKAEIQVRRQAKMQEFQERGTKRTGLLDENGDIVYGLWHNSLFCRIPENKLKGGASQSRLAAAAMFGRKLIFDFGFEEYMHKYTVRNSIDQVQEAYGLNKFVYQEPLDLWFCNFDKNSFTGKYCTENAIRNLYSGSMITVKEDCFTNHFDKSRLVYLSPNAREPLGKIHKSDDIFIIGVYNDKGNHQPISYRKAIKLGIRTKCLPLDLHLVWQGPSKSLCINHVAGLIMEAMINGSDWVKAFEKYIPKRKIKPMDQVIEEEQARRVRFKSRKDIMPSMFTLREDFDK